MMEFREVGPGEKIFLALFLYIGIPIMAAITLWESAHPYAAVSIIMLDVAVIVCSILYKGNNETVLKFLNPIMWNFIFMSVPVIIAVSYLCN
jgi:hypothetical protein